VTLRVLLSLREERFAQRSCRRKTGDERASHINACLRPVNRETVTNSSIRERFGLEESSSATASRVIRDAVEAGLIVAVDPSAAKKVMKYVPSWAVRSTRSVDGR
jgi:ATP-dependent DNA helicase RecG